VTIGSDPWFVAADVCRALGMNLGGGTHRHTGRLGPAEKQTGTGSQIAGLRTGQVALISEPGLYKLAMRSDKPQAKAFQDWIAHQVLPSIRKHGTVTGGSPGWWSHGFPRRTTEGGERCA
jgi:prophage antirepressor-like protein